MLLLVLALAAPAAMAQSSGQDGYVPDPPPPVIIDEDEESPPPPTISDDDNELAFTGLDLGLVALGGGSLLVLGFGMRRLTRES